MVVARILSGKSLTENLSEPRYQHTLNAVGGIRALLDVCVWCDVKVDNSRLDETYRSEEIYIYLLKKRPLSASSLKHGEESKSAPTSADSTVKVAVTISSSTADPVVNGSQFDDLPDLEPLPP